MSDSACTSARFTASDWFIVIVLTLTGMSLAWRHLDQPDVHQFFYQSEFAPAVMLACGRGFSDVEVQIVPHLGDFLKRSRERTLEEYACAQLPEQLPLANMTGFQATHYYLLAMVGVVWWLVGVSWGALIPVFGLFYGISAALFYGICRAAMGRMVALLMGSYLLLSSHHLDSLKNFRDYVKLPFLLAMILIITWLVRTSMSWPKRFALAGLAGGVAGVGIGFRQDLMQTVPMIIITILFFLPKPRAWRELFLAVALFMAVFVVSGWPVNSRLSGESNPSFNLIQGLTSSFSLLLGVEHSIYESGYMFHDRYSNLQVLEYAHRVQHQTIDQVITSGLDFFDKKYTTVSSDMLRNLITLYPADLALRFIASAHKIADLGMIKQHGFLLVVASALLLAIHSWRLAIFFCLVFLYFAGLPGLLFGGRHYFHLKFLPLFCTGFLLQCLVDFIITRISTSRLRQPWPWSWIGTVYNRDSLTLRRVVWSMGWFGIFSFGMLAGGLWVMRQVQATTLAPYFERIAKLPAGEPPGEKIPTPDGKKMLIRWKVPTSLPNDAVVHAHYLVIGLLPVSQCAKDAIPISILYEPTSSLDLSRELTVALDQGTLALYFPIFHDRSTIFRGVELSGEDAHCLSRLEWSPIPPGVTLLPTLVLPEDWQNRPLFHRLWLGWSPYQPLPFFLKNRQFGYDLTKGEG